MSVKITRREEKRDTSLQRFVLSALFPLLLTGLIGFFIGKTSQFDSESANFQQRVCAEEAEQTRAREQAFLRYLTEIDSLREAVNEEMKALFIKVPNTFSASVEDDLLAQENKRQLAEDYGELDEKFRSTLGRIRGEAIGNNIIAEENILRPATLVRDLLEQYGRRFSFERLHYEAKTKNEIEGEETDALQVLEFENKIQLLQSRLENEQIKSENIQLSLNRCKDEKADAGSPAGTPECDFLTEVSAIRSAVTEIGGITKSMPTGLLGSCGKKAKQVESAIGKHLTDITNAVEAINKR